MFSNTSLDFSPATAGSPTNLTVNFNLSGYLLKGETVTLALPGFTGNDSTPIVLDGWTAVWSEVDATLVLNRTNETIAAGTLTTVVIPVESGITLPEAGVPLDGETLTIATDAAAAPVTPTAITDLPAVGTTLTSCCYCVTATERLPFCEREKK